MRIPRIATLLGGLLLSRRGRGFAGRHAGKLALATVAFEMWQRHQASRPGAGAQARSETQARPKPHGRSRWSGRSHR